LFLDTVQRESDADSVRLLEAAVARVRICGA
jgi:hypothetical protein